MKSVIERISAREILSGRGRPTVEVELVTADGILVEASVPSGTSKGKYEAWEVYDGGKRYRGLGVKQAVENVNREIAPKLIGENVLAQRRIDNLLIELDGTKNKQRLGGNAILAVSLAVAKAGAATAGLPLYRYLGGLGGVRLPVPLATVLSGGKHSPSSLDFEDYILIFDGFSCFADALEALVETRYLLEKNLRQMFGLIADDGGALAPPLSDTRQAFELMLEAAQQAGYGGKVALGLDVAASDLYLNDKGLYQVGGREMEPAELIDYYICLAKQYPLVYIEDPFDQDDFESFAKLTAALPDRKIVGDDLFVTNPERIRMGIERKAGNTLLLKVNQIGTVSEAYDAGVLALQNGLAVTVSLRSSDTNDSFIADLAVGLGAEQIKLGSPVRGERNAKYNRLLKIEAELGKAAKFAGKTGCV
ncbi:MAG TPA: phosphopyruvate hydratase [Capillibacterium sp.]